MQDDNDKSKFFLRVREQLRYWPHTLHQIEDTLDIGLIEGKGRQIVYQALNARNLTIFAGSGLSLAYGRMSWWDWRETQLGIVKSNADAFLTLAQASYDWLSAVHTMLKDLQTATAAAPEPLDQKYRYAMWRWVGSMQRAVLAAQHHVKGLDDSLRLCRAEEKDAFVGGDANTMLFDLANQLHDAVEQHADMFLGTSRQRLIGADFVRLLWPGVHVEDNPGAVPGSAAAALTVLDWQVRAHPAYVAYRNAYYAFATVMSRPLARDSIEDQARRLLSSECAHALSILKAGLTAAAPNSPAQTAAFETIRQALPFPELDDLQRAYPGIRDDPEKYKALAPFLRESFKALLTSTQFPSGWGRAARRTAAGLRQTCQNRPGRMVPHPVDAIPCGCAVVPEA